MPDGPIGEAFVEILPQTDEAKFEAALEKIGTILGAKIASAFDKTSTAVDKATAKTKVLGDTGKTTGEKIDAGAKQATTGLGKIHAQLDKNITALQKFEKEGEHSSSTFKRIGTRIVEAFSIYALAEFVKKSVEVTEIFERTKRVVEQAIKTTGGAAGVTTDQFLKLGDTMALATGIATTTINSANQQLLAFTNIRNEVGKGNDIFTRAASSIQDISVRTGLGSISIARSLGKALEDPAKASLVLRRASILLTKTQQDQIKVFQKNHDILGAQKIILDAISQKFGGAAKAASDPLKQLAEATNQIERSLGEALLPTIDDLAKSIVRHVPDIKAFVEEAGVKLHNALIAVTPAVKNAAHFIGQLVSLYEHHAAVREFVKALLEAVVAYKILREVVKVALELQIAFNAVLDANPIALVVLGLAALTAAFIYTYTHAEQVRNILENGFNGAVKGIGAALKFIVDAFIDFAASVVKIAASAFGWVPGLGPQLRGAARDVDAFKKSTNDSIDGITKDVMITVHETVVQAIVQVPTGAIVGPIAPGSPLDIQNRPHQVGPVAPGSAQAKSAAAAKAALDKANKDAAAWLKAQQDKLKPPIDWNPPDGKKKKAKVHADLVELLRQSNTTLVASLEKGTAAASKAISSIEAKVKSTLKGTLDEGLTSKTLKFIEQQRDALGRLAGSYITVSKQTDALRKKVDLLKQAAADFKNSVLSALQNASNLDAFLNKTTAASSSGFVVDNTTPPNPSMTKTAPGTGSTGGAAGSAAAYINFLTGQSKQLEDFQKNLTTLISRVGDSAFVQELASKGLDSSAFVASLAAAPKTALDSINKLQSQVLTLQHSVANAAGKALQTAADKQNSLLTKSVSTQDKMLVELKAVSSKIIHGLAQVLGSKVPKFAGGTYNAPSGWALIGEHGPELKYMRGGERIIPASATRAMLSNSLISPSQRVFKVDQTFNLIPQGDPEMHAKQIAIRSASWADR